MVLKGLEQLVEEAAMQAFEPNINNTTDEKKFASFRKAAGKSVICVHVKLDGINIAVPVINQNQSLAHLAKVCETSLKLKLSRIFDIRQYTRLAIG